MTQRIDKFVAACAIAGAGHAMLFGDWLAATWAVIAAWQSAALITRPAP